MPQNKDLERLVRFSDDPQLVILDEIDDLKAVVSDIKDTFTQVDLREAVIRGEQGLKGEKGDTPLKGIDFFTNEEVERFLRATTPLKGTDYFTSEEVAAFKKEVTPVKGKDFRDGIDGKDGKNGAPGKDGIDGKDGDSADLDGEEIANRLEDLPNEKKLDPEKALKDWKKLKKGFGKIERIVTGGGGSNSAAGVTWKGDWNAATNTPTLTVGGGTAGETYKVTVAGTTSLSATDNSVQYWEVGDWAMKMDDGTWQKISNNAATPSKTITQTAHGFAAPTTFIPVYFNNATDTWVASDADDAQTEPEGYIVRVLDVNTFVLQTNGIINRPSHGLTVGAPLYVSNTAGSVTETQPTAGLSFVIGEAIDADNIQLRAIDIPEQGSINRTGAVGVSTATTTNIFNTGENLIPISGATADFTLTIATQDIQNITNRAIIIKDEAGVCDDFTVTIVGQGGELIDGQSQIRINNAYGSVTMYSTGTQLFTFQDDKPRRSVRAVTATETLTFHDDVILASNTITLTLPTAVNFEGTELTVRNIGTGTVTIDGNAAETISSTNPASPSTTIGVAVGESYTLISDNSNWHVI